MFWFMLLTMKYVWIGIAIVLLVRIDFIMGLIDKGIVKFQTPKTPEAKVADLPASSEIIPMTDDKVLKQSPKAVLFSLIQNFHLSPNAQASELIINELRNHPTMFTTKLDKELETQIYQWRDLVIQGNKETALLLIELMKYLQGENFDMIRRFFSLWIDVDLEQFLSFYSKSKDTNCGVITLLADPVPEEEKITEFLERENDLNALLTKEKVDPVLKKYADICLLMVKVHINKLAPTPAPAPTAAPVIPEGSQP